VRVLDTDTLIEILRGNERVVERRAAVADEVATTWVCAAELYFGAALSAKPAHNRELVHALLATMPVLGLDGASAQIFGEAKALLRRAGRAPADADLLIASVTTAAGAVLVTGNRAHFEHFPGLTVEDWVRG
jgi:tRNA(fMet)-specific endonuclease VapC